MKKKNKEKGKRYRRTPEEIIVDRAIIVEKSILGWGSRDIAAFLNSMVIDGKPREHTISHMQVFRDRKQAFEELKSEYLKQMDDFMFKQNMRTEWVIRQAAEAWERSKKPIKRYIKIRGRLVYGSDGSPLVEIEERPGDPRFLDAILKAADKAEIYNKNPFINNKDIDHSEESDGTELLVGNATMKLGSVEITQQMERIFRTIKISNK